MTAADTFRKVDGLAAEARRDSNEDVDRQVVSGKLWAIQDLAQNGLREAIADEAKLAAFDGLLAVTQKTAAWLVRLAKQAEAQAQQSNQFETLVEACTADARNYRAVASDLHAEIAQAKEQTAPDADAPRAG